MNRILILAVGAVLASAGPALAGGSGGHGGGGHGGGGGGCGGGCGGGGGHGGGGHGGGWGGNFNSNLNVNVNANASAYAGASSYINARGYSGYGRMSGGGYAYGGGGGGGYDGYMGMGPGYVGALVSGPVVTAGPSAPFGYAVGGFGRDYSSSCGSANRYSWSRPQNSGCAYPPPPPPPSCYDPCGGGYPAPPSHGGGYPRPDYPRPSYPGYPAHDCDCDYPVSNQPFYGVAPPGPPIRGRQGGVRVSGPPVYARQPDAYIQGGPVYVDAPPVNVAPARIYLEAPDVHVRPSQVNVAPPEIHYLPARPPHEPEDACCEVTGLPAGVPEGAIVLQAPPLPSQDAVITFSEGTPYGGPDHFE